MAFRSLPLTLLLLLFLRPLLVALVFTRPFSLLLLPSLLSVASPSDTLSICVVIGSLSAAVVAPSCCSSDTGVAEGVVMETVDGEVGLSSAGVAYTTFSLLPLVLAFARRKAKPRRKERARRPSRLA